MRIVDIFGEDVTNLVNIEPYTCFKEYDGVKLPITKVTYGIDFIRIEWERPPTAYSPERRRDIY